VLPSCALIRVIRPFYCYIDYTAKRWLTAVIRAPTDRPTDEPGERPMLMAAREHHSCIAGLRRINVVRRQSVTKWIIFVTKCLLPRQEVSTNGTASGQPDAVPVDMSGWQDDQLQRTRVYGTSYIRGLCELPIARCCAYFLSLSIRMHLEMIVLCSPRSRYRLLLTYRTVTTVKLGLPVGVEQSFFHVIAANLSAA